MFFATRLLLIFLFATQMVRAAVLASTEGGTDGSYSIFVTSSHIYGSLFLTGEDVTSVTEVRLNTNNTSSQAAELIVELREVVGGGNRLPSSVVGTFDTTITVPGNSSFDYRTATDAGVVLQPNTYYWLVVRSAFNGGGGAGLRLKNGTGMDAGSIYSPSGLDYYYSSNGGSSWDRVGPYSISYRLSGEVVPEASSIAIFSLGVIAVFLRRHRC